MDVCMGPDWGFTMVMILLPYPACPHVFVVVSIQHRDRGQDGALIVVYDQDFHWYKEAFLQVSIIESFDAGWDHMDATTRTAPPPLIAWPDQPFTTIQPKHPDGKQGG
jgi:hypothetical protein